MIPYKDLSKKDLLILKEKYESEFEKIKLKHLNLNIELGKPSIEQIKLSMKMIDCINENSNLISEDGTDCRNYGNNTGIIEAKKLMAEIMGVEDFNNVIIFGNSSLNIMYDIISHSFTHGVLGNTPWCKLDRIKFLCPSPGYDRHFKITEYFGFDLIPIPMLESGPDMDLIEEYIKDDDVKGIWCVPKYSNPQGITYSDETVKRFAKLNPKAKDFRIFWDDAYCMHNLYENDQDKLLEIYKECKKNNNENIIYKFASTSKISIPGAGISAIFSSNENKREIQEFISYQTIGYDKLNQMRHVKFFENYQGILEHMKKQANIIRPKFEMVINTLESELLGLEIGTWTKPKGGYFITFKALNGCAKLIVKKAKEAGLTLTPAGVMYPYKNDPDDSYIRIAPTFPTLTELKIAIMIFILSVKIVSIDKFLSKK